MNYRNVNIQVMYIQYTLTELTQYISSTKHFRLSERILLLVVTSLGCLTFALQDDVQSLIPDS